MKLWKFSSWFVSAQKARYACIIAWLFGLMIAQESPFCSAISKK